KPRSRALLILGSVVLVILSGMLVYQWDQVVHSWRTWRDPAPGQAYFAAPEPPVEDAALLKELQDATLLEEEPPPGAAGWPQWRGPGRDGVAFAGDLIENWPRQGPPLAWQKNVGESYSAFVGDGSRVYTMVREGNQEVILCWELDTGTEKWRHAYECAYRESTGSGPRSTPSLADGKLYAVGATGLLHCLEAATGGLVWSQDLLKKFQASNPSYGLSFSPLVEGSLVFTNPGGSRD